MYGELDQIFITASQSMARSMGGTLMSVQVNGVKQQQAYVGNVAYGFVCAETTLYKGQLNKGVTSASEETINRLSDKIRQRSKHEVVKSDDADDVIDKKTEHVFYLPDDTPSSDPFEFQGRFLERTGYSMSKFRLPLPVLIISFFFLYYLIKLVRVLLKVNYRVSSAALYFFKKPYIFSGVKAREKLGYQPLYTPEQAFTRSMEYYKKNSKS